MGRTGRKTTIAPEVKKRVLDCAAKNPSMSHAEIAERFPMVSARVVQYVITRDKQAKAKKAKADKPAE